MVDFYEESGPFPMHFCLTDRQEEKGFWLQSHEVSVIITENRSEALVLRSLAIQIEKEAALFRERRRRTVRKRILGFSWALLILLFLCACAGAPAPGPTEAPGETTEPAPPSAEPTASPEASAEPTTSLEASAEPTALPEASAEPTPGREPVRAGIAFDGDLDPEEGIRRIQEALGHELDVVWRMKSANVISVNVDRTELERIRQVDGVRSVEEELLNEPTAGAGTGAAPGASG